MCIYIRISRYIYYTVILSTQFENAPNFAFIPHDIRFLRHKYFQLHMAQLWPFVLPGSKKTNKVIILEA